MTANVRKTRKLRAGNGLPSASVNGSESAAASETTPRIPAQPTIVTPCQGGYGCVFRKLSERNRGRYAPGNIHDEADDHHRAERREHAVHDGGPGAVEAVEDHRELEPDEDEHERVEQEHERLPDRGSLESRRGRPDVRHVAPLQQPAHDHGEDARDVQPFRHDVDEEREENRRRRREDRLVEKALDPDEEEPHREPHRDASRDEEQELENAGRDRERARHDGGRRELQEHEARRVVHEALPFEDGHDLSRKMQPLRDRGGGDGVRRRDDRAEHEGDGPRDSRDERVDRRRDRRRRRDDEAHGQERDREEIRPEVAPRGEVPGGVQDGRQEEQEDDLRVERHAREETGRTPGPSPRRRERSDTARSPCAPGTRAPS